MYITLMRILNAQLIMLIFAASTAFVVPLARADVLHPTKITANDLHAS
jgi:hypothetical protein